jgi:hypothetical protein
MAEQAKPLLFVLRVTARSGYDSRGAGWRRL